MALFKTQNDLKSNTKTTVIELLNSSWPTAIDLALLTKQAHWNLKGPQFIAIHEMIDSFRTEIDDSCRYDGGTRRAARRHRARHDAGRQQGHQP